MNGDVIVYIYVKKYDVNGVMFLCDEMLFLIIEEWFVMCYFGCDVFESLVK